MPDHPEWYSKIPQALAELQAMPADRPVTTNELIISLRVSKRTAQMILAPIATLNHGRGKAAPRLTVLSHLHSLAQTDAGQQANAEYEHMKQVVAQLVEDRRRNGTPVIVEVPAQEVKAIEFDNLPGVQIVPGRLIIDAADAQDAARKLIRLGIAMQRDLAGFDHMISPRPQQRSFSRECLGELFEQERA